MLQLLNDFPFARNAWANDFFRELDRMMSPAKSAVGDTRALINVYADNDRAKVMVALPGWKAEWFDLSTEGDKLHVKGTSKFEGDNRTNLTVERTVNLPFRVDDARVTAAYSHGVLTVDLHRSEQDKPRKIAVNAA